MAKRQNQRAGKKAGKAGRARRATRGRRTRTVKADALSLSSPASGSHLRAMKIGDLYRPLKKPITVRIDADVLAWFKKGGRRYQTRINLALRSVMEREMRSGSSS